MSQWGNKNLANNTPNFLARQFELGSGKAAQAANNTLLFHNTSPGALESGHVAGSFGAEAACWSNSSGEVRSKLHNPGWQIRTVGQGPVVSVTATGGTNIANGETVVISSASGAQANAVVTLTANATGNVAYGTVTVGGSFVNVGSVTYTATRELHAQATATALNSNAAAGTVPNSNAVFVMVSNTVYANGAAFANGVNAFGVFIANATGGWSNTQSQTAIFTANSTYSNLTVGLFGSTQTNSALVLTFTNSTGGVLSTGTSNTGIIASSNTGVIVSAPVLGGRAGRVSYETIVAMKTLTVNTGSNTIQLPIT